METTKISNEQLRLESKILMKEQMDDALNTVSVWEKKFQFAIVSAVFFIFSSVMCFVNPDISNVFGYSCLPVVLVFGVLIIRSFNYLKMHRNFIPMVESLHRVIQADINALD